VQRVFVVQHEAEETGDVKLIGVYSSADAAERAIDRLRDKPGFRDQPQGFSVDPYPIDQDHWSEGFVSPHE
jgi:hypothetical protein